MDVLTIDDVGAVGAKAAQMSDLFAWAHLQNRMEPVQTAC